MFTSADKDYGSVMFYVLNKIRDSLIFNPGGEKVADYYFDLSVGRATVGSGKEKSLLQKLRNDGVISDMAETDVAEIGKRGTLGYKAYDIYHLRISEKFDDYYDQYQRIQAINLNYCWFDNNSFFLTLRDGSLKTISFDTERNSRQGLALFQTMIENWKKNGSTPIAGDEIVKGMAKFGSKVDVTQLHNIISNVHNKKIIPAGLNDKITVGYDRKARGWKLEIKR
ncbi:MAG: hypothetical protein NT162_01445 [Candidatus Woesebacteria bacterium]|nr:hypothetical protein [Candidatus Woesebacteria bacterium]